jgi:phenylalanyl-tRNA synthetase beta chain
MRIPLSWLGEYVDLAADITPEQVHEDLVKVGFEEEDIHGFEVTGPVVVGEVLEFTPEEQSNGKTINWCQVRVAPAGQKAADGGDDVRGIICGAQNFVVGDKVVACLPGAVLPGPFAISARKTYGHVSDGMLASGKELGLGDDHSGILRLNTLFAPEDLVIGSDAKVLLGVEDSAVEINVTPDRGYAFSIRGISREYSHSTGAAFRDPAEYLLERDGVTAPTSFATTFPVSVDDSTPIRGRDAVSVFATRVVRGVDATRSTPAWMSGRLKLAGIRSISLIVDISNYVMVELGQPNHAYDLDTLAGDIVVRRAKAGEKLTTLDEVERTLGSEDLLITSGGKAVGLAGVMGGAATEISDGTTNVLIEAANFDPVPIARAVRRHKLHSEASKRFERGVDPAVAAVAAGRVAQLIVQLAGGEIVDEGSFFSTASAPAAIELPNGFVSGLIGYAFTDEQILGALTEIGCAVHPGSHGPAVMPPTWRPDLTDKWTLAEEVIRIVGYDKIPATLPVAPPGRGYTVAQQVRRRVAQTLAATGHTETLSYPFFNEETNNLFGSATAAEVPQVRLANALDSEQGWMRTSLLPGLIGTAARNRSRGFTDLAIFETGSVFLPAPGVTYGHGILPGAVRPAPEQEAQLHAAIPPQPRHIAAVYTGESVARQPGQKALSFSWQDALDAVQQIALAAGVTLLVKQGSHKAFHPGRTAEILLSTGETVGYAGELLPAVTEGAHLPRVVPAFELNLDAITDVAGAPHSASAIDTMPAATQDLSLVVASNIPVNQIQDAVLTGAGELLESISLVDIYAGEGVPQGHRSITFALRFRAADRTLTQAEATEAKLAGVKLAAETFGATIRD